MKTATSMKNATTAVLDGPLKIVLTLAVCSLGLGLLAYVPTWHGSNRSLLRIAFWAVAGLSVILIPLSVRPKK